MRGLCRFRVVRWFGTLLLLAGLLIAAANVYVLSEGSGATDDVRDVRHAQVAIVLGAMVHRDGKMSAMLADRVRRAEQLFRAGKVDRILVTGDHRAWRYDETGTMRTALLRAGIPPAAIFTDHAGIDTHASMVRARRIFGVRTAIVVTQGFHMARALYLARDAGIDAQGVTSDIQGYGGKVIQSDVREVLARVKAVGDVVLGSDVQGGPRHPISGDGRGSWGPTPPAGSDAPAASTPGR
ncbi:SanA/YdcF family protein [Patulibacter defluvii]|uniref:SanA/YdcF family protein n=1 Tax=Patulibacter defluvii TaxID=3095358 RepID=UPI002A74BE0B|nr:ElyC/SanA/YdcF family protein [Patulibacter sp. DM4]